MRLPSDASPVTDADLKEHVDAVLNNKECFDQQDIDYSQAIRDQSSVPVGTRDKLD